METQNIVFINAGGVIQQGGGLKYAKASFQCHLITQGEKSKDV